MLSGALICYRLSVNDVRQIRGQLIPLVSGTPHSLTAASWAVRSLGRLKKRAFIFLLSLGSLCKFPLAYRLHTPCVRELPAKTPV